MICVPVGIFALTQATVPYMYIQIYLYIKHSNTWLGFSCKVDGEASFDWGRGCCSSYHGHGTAGNNLQIRHIMLLHACMQHKWGKKKSFCHYIFLCGGGLKKSLNWQRVFGKSFHGHALTKTGHALSKTGHAWIKLKWRKKQVNKG